MSLIATRSALIRPFSPPGGSEYQTQVLEAYLSQTITPPDWARIAMLHMIGGGAPGQFRYEDGYNPYGYYYGGSGGCSGDIVNAIVPLIGGDLIIEIGPGGYQQDNGDGSFTAVNGGATIVRDKNYAALATALGGRAANTRHAANDYSVPAKSRVRLLGFDGGESVQTNSGVAPGGGGAAGLQGEAGEGTAINNMGSASGGGPTDWIWAQSARTTSATAIAPAGVIPAQAGGNPSTNHNGRAGGGAGAGGGAAGIGGGVGGTQTYTRWPGGRGASGAAIITFIS